MKEKIKIEHASTIKYKDMYFFIRVLETGEMQLFVEDEWVNIFSFEDAIKESNQAL